MENLDVVGEFWKADDPAQKVPGRFTFDAATGGELNLDGCFWEHSQPGIRTISFGSEASKEPIRILGNAGGRLLTLYYCHRAGMSGGMGYGLPTHLSERYIVQIALSGGVHFYDEQESQFNKAQFQFHQMEHWIGMSGIHVEADSNLGTTEQMRVIINPLESLRLKSDIGELELSFIYNQDSNLYQSSIKQTCILTTMFESAASLDMILMMCSKLQNLLTICMDRVTDVVEIKLHQHDNLPINCYMLFQGSDVKLKQSTSASEDLLCGFIDIGQLEGIAKWLNVSDVFAPAIGALMSR